MPCIEVAWSCRAGGLVVGNGLELQAQPFGKEPPETRTA